MKRILTLTLLLLTLTACAQTEATPAAASTPVPPTATTVPTATHTPEPTLTPTPVPYYLEDGILYNLDEATGEYILVGEGLAAITTTAEGIVAVDGDGEALFTYDAEDQVWVEVERVYHSGVEAIPDVEARAVEELGMSLHDAWEQALDKYPNFISTSMGYGRGEVTYRFISLGHETISMANVAGFSDTDRMICLYLYRESNAGDISTVPVPVFVEQNGELKPLGAVVENNYPFGNDVPFVEREVNNFDEAVALVSRLRVGRPMFTKLQINWQDEDIDWGWMYEISYLENKEVFLSGDYVSRLSVGDYRYIWEVMERLNDDDFGVFANQVSIYAEENFDN